MFSRLKRKIKNLIKTAILNSIDEKDVYQILNSRGLDNEQTAVLYNPYGIHSYPVKNSLVTLLNLNGKETSKIGLCWNPKSRPEGLKEGEIYFHNEKTESHIYIKDNGDIVAEAPGTKTSKITLTQSGSVEIDSDSLSVTGDLTVEGTSTLGGIVFGTHKHPPGTFQDGEASPITGQSGDPV